MVSGQNGCFHALWFYILQVLEQKRIVSCWMLGYLKSEGVVISKFDHAGELEVNYETN